MLLEIMMSKEYEANGISVLPAGWTAKRIVALKTNSLRTVYNMKKVYDIKSVVATSTRKKKHKVRKYYISPTAVRRIQGISNEDQ